MVCLFRMSRETENWSDEKKGLYDLVHFAGVNMDPILFENINELLEQGRSSKHLFYGGQL